MNAEDQDMARVQAALDLLTEHFDASRHEPATEDGTVSCARGLGNWFARMGQVREWMVQRDEESRGTVRRDE